MGGDYYDRDVVSSTDNRGFSAQSNEILDSRTEMHSSMNPLRWEEEKLRCENLNPIVFALDVTGSMGDWTKVIIFYFRLFMIKCQCSMVN